MEVRGWRLEIPQSGLLNEAKFAAYRVACDGDVMTVAIDAALAGETPQDPRVVEENGALTLSAQEARWTGDLKLESVQAENCVEFTGSRESRLPLDLHARDCLRRADDARSGREQFARGVAAAGAVGRWQVHGFPACGCAQLVHERCHCALRTRCVAGVHHSFHRRFGSASGTSGSVCACRGVCVGEVRQNTGPTAARGFEGQRARASRGLAVPPIRLRLHRECWLRSSCLLVLAL